MNKLKHSLKSYVLKNQEIYVGLEDSKRTWKLCIRNNGIIVTETSMPAKFDVLESYFRNKFPGCKIKIIYEAGFRGFNIYDELTNNGWECIVTPPHTVTEEKCSMLKNDKIDAKRLAKNLENNDYHCCFVPNKELRENRQVSRLFSQVKNDIVRISNRIRRSLEFHGLDYFFKAGSWTHNDYKFVKSSLEDMNISASLKLSLNMLFYELSTLWDLKKEIRAKLKEFAKTKYYKSDVDIIQSIPGIGSLTAIRIALEIGNINRFKRKESFANFLGLIPKEYSSGNSVHKGHITKQGNKYIRSWLIESAWIAIRYDPVLLEKFQRVFSSCGSKKKAIVAVARKIAIRLRSLLINREKYTLGLAK